MAKLVIFLISKEMEALEELAKHEFRDPRSQAALIIHQTLEKSGYLNFDSYQTESINEVQDE